MNYKLPLISAALIALMACSQAISSTASESAANESAKAESVKDKTVKAAQSPSIADISKAPAGIYKPLGGHAYITFQYLHQGFARPTLRWNDFEAELDLNPEKPEQSSLSVIIDAGSIDSGVEALDDHLAAEDFFDVDNFPEIEFTSTELVQKDGATGTLKGILTIKDIAKPVTMEVTLNKVGQHFRNKKPMLGLSATTQIKRSEWDMGLYTPSVGDEVDISVEIEFIKDDET